jgi:hypothetical protein
MANYDFSGLISYLKNHLRESVKVVFFDAQDAEYDFARPFDTLKYRFIDITKVVFKTF